MGVPTLRLMGIGVVNPCCKSGHQSRIIEIAMNLVKGGWRTQTSRYDKIKFP